MVTNWKKREMNPIFHKKIEYDLFSSSATFMTFQMQANHRSDFLNMIAFYTEPSMQKPQNLEVWDKHLGLRFNARSKSQKIYSIDGQVLQQVQRNSYLGLQILEVLKWTTHYSQMKHRKCMIFWEEIVYFAQWIEKNRLYIIIGIEYGLGSRTNHNGI